MANATNSMHVKCEIALKRTVWAYYTLLHLLVALVIVGISAPLIATYLGGRSLADDKPYLKVVDPKIAPGELDEAGWKRTCGWMSLFALIGALATAIQTGLNVGRNTLSAYKRMKRLDVLLCRCSLKRPPSEIKLLNEYEAIQKDFDFPLTSIEDGDASNSAN